MELYLHIGTAKTGTTSIQKFMSKQRDELLNHGYLYPRSPGNARHVSLSFYAKPAARVVQMNEWIRADIPDIDAFRSGFEAAFRDEITASSAKRVILSDEGLSGMATPDITRLHGLLADLFDRIYVVVYIRPQGDLLPSRYQQNIRMGHTYTLEEFLASLEAQPQSLNYHQRLQRWAAVFGAENLRPRVFQSSRLVGSSLLADFRHVVGLPDVGDNEHVATEMTNDSRENASLDADRLEYLRRMNLLMEGAGTPRERVMFRRYMGKLLARQSDGPILSPPRAQLDEITERLFAKSNEQAARKFVHPDGGVDQLFDPPAQGKRTVARPGLDLDRSMQIGFEASFEIWKQQRRARKALTTRTNVGAEPRDRDLAAQLHRLEMERDRLRRQLDLLRFWRPSNWRLYPGAIGARIRRRRKPLARGNPSAAPVDDYFSQGDGSGK